MIKTILCDLGNVIVFVNHKKIAQGLAKFSDKSEEYIYHFFLNSIAHKGFDKGKISATKLFMIFKNNLNLKLNFNQFKKIWSSCFRPNKDMEALLYKLKKNYKLILLSNTDEIHFTYCKEKYKVLDIFDDFILSYKIGHRKPNPLIYLSALKKAKTFPSHILYIDDIHRFVKTVKFFGIKSIQYKNIQKLKSDLKRINVEI
ncbi:MAG: HAD-IA family hydrolase [Candidatus Woesearchaeota archaeon]|jgi:putative hydrolase of the HAD superfamily|nr:HAD-IA family hydrolase [Candidatus Woesearchaeota archaeon]MDP7244108.1 HAD-IA family hydrolase [Flavobacteriales bacterium]|tara:strand:- start:3935 stop:4537 length:603 start_codon:yes stop_codon:yes gene_type:complete